VSGGKNWNISKMKFTGTLIEDLMATVERAEQRAQSDADALITPQLVETSAVDPSVAAWFASVQENADYDLKLMGVA